MHQLPSFFLRGIVEREKKNKKKQKKNKKKQKKTKVAANNCYFDCSENPRVRTYIFLRVAK